MDDQVAGTSPCRTRTRGSACGEVIEALAVLCYAPPIAPEIDIPG